MHVEHHDTIEQLRRLRRLKSHGRIATRLQVIVLARQGRTALEVADATGLSRRPVQQWVRRYNAEGVDGLWDRPRSGKPTHLPRDQEESLKQRLNAGPTEADGGVCTLRGKEVVRILREEFGVHYSLGAVYHLLARLGFSCLKPRPQHRKNDPEAMAAWEQDTPLLSSASKSKSPGRTSRSGSKTKRG